MAEVDFVPRVSVVSIFYNAETCIEEAIASVLSQACQDFELLLVDEGSTNASSAIALEHPARAAELYSLHGAGRPLHRLLLRPLAAVPFFPFIVGGTALWLSDRDERLPMGLRRFVPLLFSAARDLIYWASVREGTKALGTR